SHLTNGVTGIRTSPKGVVSVANAWYGCGWPTPMGGSGGGTSIEGVGDWTASVVLSGTGRSVGLMFGWPTVPCMLMPSGENGMRARASPRKSSIWGGVNTATSGSEDVHVTMSVQSYCLPSLKVAVALNCCVCPG